MGYCSNVALCLDSVSEALLKERYEKAENDMAPYEYQSLRELLFKSDEMHEKYGSTLRIWRAQKWHMEFVEIDFLHQLFDEMEYEGFIFYRIGEELDDVRREGGYFDNPFGLRISRGFSFNN